MNGNEDRREALVSVLVPAYNAASTLGCCLKSIQDQTHKNLEILVISDGSTDSTELIVQAYSEKDCRIRLLRQDNQGPSAARNLAIREAKGDFFAPCDADDVWRPDKIARQMELVGGASDNIGLVYCWSAEIDGDGRITGLHHRPHFEGDVFLELCRWNFVGNGSAALMPADLVRSVGGFDPSLRGCEDWKLYLQMAQSHSFRVVPDFLVAYRRSGTSSSSSWRTLINGFRALMPMFEGVRPGARRALRAGENGLLSFLAQRAAQERRFHDYGVILLELMRRAPRLTLTAIAKSSFRQLRRPTRPPGPHFLSEQDV